MTAEQWTTIHLGTGGRGESITMLAHRACGALIADRDQHEKVCTAPPWAPTPPVRTIHDWYSGGRRT